MANRWRTVSDVREFFSQPYHGSAETAVHLGWQLLEYHFPWMRRVVIRRAPEAVVDALMALPMTRHCLDLEKTRWVMRRGARSLDALAKRPGVLVLDYDDLKTEAACKALFERCLPYRCPEGWWEQWAAVNVQSDHEGTFDYQVAHRDGILQFKATAMRELFRLRRAGLIRRVA